jgi:hypothetical protein
MKRFLLLPLLCLAALAQLGGPAIDPQEIGWESMPTNVAPQGRVVTRPSQYHLVPKAIRTGNTPGGSFFLYEGTGVTWAPVFRANNQSSYSGHAMAVTVAGATTATNFNYAKIKFTCYGRRVGVQWYNASGQPTNTFNVVIDGTPYVVDPVNRDATTQKVQGPDPFLTWIVPEQLDDTRHTVELVFSGSNTAGDDRAWTLWNVLLDATAGYVAQRPLDNLYGPQTATTSYASFSVSSPWDATDVRVLKVVAVNVSGSAATISVANTASDTTRFVQKSIAAGDTYVFDLGPNGAGFAPIYIKSDTGSAIYVWVQANTL